MRVLSLFLLDNDDLVRGRTEGDFPAPALDVLNQWVITKPDEATGERLRDVLNHPLVNGSHIAKKFAEQLVPTQSKSLLFDFDHELHRAKQKLQLQRHAKQHEHICTHCPTMYRLQNNKQR